MLTWETSSEVQTLGFHLWRSATGSRVDAVQITGALIIANGNPTAGALYRWTDTNVQPGVRYTYWLQEVQLNALTKDIGVVQSQFQDDLYLPLIVQ